MMGLCLQLTSNRRIPLGQVPSGGHGQHLATGCKLGTSTNLAEVLAECLPQRIVASEPRKGDQCVATCIVSCTFSSGSCMMLVIVSRASA